MLLLSCLTACASGAASAPYANTPVSSSASYARAAVAPSASQASTSLATAGSHASVWFHPIPAAADGGPPGGLGSVDFLDLFAADAAWPQAAAHTSIFGLYAGWIPSVDDQTLRQTVAFLNAHRMGIELEAPALQALPTCGSGVEGYVPYGDSLHDLTLGFLQRLKAFGGRLTYVKADEPFFFGSVSTDPRACRFSVAQVVEEFRAFALLVKSVYPDAQVGDVEPMIVTAYTPDPVTALGRWHDAYRLATGEPLPFFIADMDFSNVAWPSLAKTMEIATHRRGMRFGIIYSGDPSDASDAEWSGKAVARFEAYEGANGGRPDYALFQSWMQHPRHCLPETDPTTFTGVLDAYLATIHGNPVEPDSPKT